MLIFDYQKSCKLDENIIYKLTSLLTGERENKEFLSKNEFTMADQYQDTLIRKLKDHQFNKKEMFEKNINLVLKERNVINELFSKINDERKVN